MNPQRAMLFALHIARGMRYACEALPGLVHRDLKPENILVGYDQVAKVTDFGLARHNARMNDALEKGIVNGGGGTFWYMPPEQWVGGSSLDQRTDIYAFGCILYEMLSGELYVDGDGAQQIAQEHFYVPSAKRISTLWSGAHDLLLTCLQKDMRNRPCDWAQVEQYIDTVFHQSLGQSLPPSSVVKGSSMQEIAKGESYILIGGSYAWGDHLSEAEHYYERALRIGHHLNHPKLRLRAYQGLGEVADLRRDAAKSIEFYRLSLQEVPSVNDLRIEAYLLHQLGGGFLLNGDISGGLKYYGLALKLAEEIGDVEFLSSLITTSTSRLHRAGVTSPLVLELARKAHALDLERGETKSILASHLLLADVSREQGLLPQSAGHANEAIEIARQLGERRGEAWSFMALGKTLLSMDRPMDAYSAYSDAFLLASEAQDWSTYTDCALALAKILYGENKDLETALNLAERALENYSASPAATHEAEEARALTGQIKMQMR